MNIIKKLSLKAKILFLTMIVASFIVLTSFTILIIYQINNYKADLVHTIDAVAGITATYNKSSIEFGDHDSAKKNLSFLSLEPSIESAIIIDNNNKIFAEFKKNNSTLNKVEPGDSSKEENYFFTLSDLTLFKYISDDSGNIGKLVINSNLKHLYSSIIYSGIIGALLLGISLLVSYFLALRLQKLITNPIIGLVETSKLVSNTSNFSLRAVKASEDETGLLVDNFNDMLAQIEIQNQELSNHQKQLLSALNEAKEASKAKSIFLATMSHEIRTPLNGVQGSLHIIKNSNLNEKQSEFIDIAIKSCESLNSIISDVLDFSKIEAGKMTLDIKDVEIINLINHITISQSARARQKNLVLTNIISPEIPWLVKTDETRLSQILLNLIGNSIKFTESGHVLLNLSLISETKDNAKIRFEIKDTGVGIKDEDKVGLFKAFSQADGSTSRKYGGTGLGLVICKQLVELMGGHISYDSHYGRGTIFTIDISFLKSKDSKKLKDYYDPSIKNKTAIILNDNISMNEIISKQLINSGFRVNYTSDVDEAIGKFLNISKSFNDTILLLSNNYIHNIEVNKKLASLNCNKVLLIQNEEEHENISSNYFKVRYPQPQCQLYASLSSLYSIKHEETKVIVAHENKHAGIKILVGEDNEINKIIISELLSQKGIKPEIFDNGKAVINKYKNNNFDIVFLDIHFPDMDGFQICNAIKEINKTENRSCEIIALTADVGVEIRDKCIESGMNDFLPKPIEPEVLFKILNNYATS